MSIAFKKGYANGTRVTWSKGKKMTREHSLKNMKAHLKYNVTLEWLNQFEDVKKLSYLNILIGKAVNRRFEGDNFTVESYKQYIEKFYHDNKFNDLYEKWMATGDRWVKPSLDHIVSTSKGGHLTVENIQIISWLENRIKTNMSQDEWEKMKSNLSFYL